MIASAPQAGALEAGKRARKQVLRWCIRNVIEARASDRLSRASPSWIWPFLEAISPKNILTSRTNWLGVQAARKKFVADNALGLIYLLMASTCVPAVRVYYSLSRLYILTLLCPSLSSDALYGIKESLHHDRILTILIIYLLICLKLNYLIIWYLTIG